MKDNYIIGIIGVGNMGEALVRGLLRSQLVRPYEVIAADRNIRQLHHLEKTYGIHTTSKNSNLVETTETLILAVKPQDMDCMLGEIKSVITKKHLIISIAAGVDVARLRKHLGSKPRLVRVMPNLSVLVDEGISAIYTNYSMPERYRRFAHQIFQAVGQTLDIHDEKMMDVITALSGTGPAYLFALMEAFRDTAIKLGLSPSIANNLMLQTMTGAAELAKQMKVPPEKLRERVTSKKGTTWAAMKVFQKRHFWKIVEEAIVAAAKRSAELRK